MRDILYLSLMLLLPSFLIANHGRDQLNGKWISPYHGQQIKLKVKRNRIRVKNLTSRNWSTFRPTRTGLFVDRNGNRIRIQNVHELIFRSSCGTERITFVKNDHNHHNHFCTDRCTFENAHFSYRDVVPYEEYQNHTDQRYNEVYDRNDRWYNRSGQNSNGQLSGRYYVREIDEYVTIEGTRDGLRARRGDRDWVTYRQNRNRKNEYVDTDGNRYLVKSEGRIVWKNRTGTVTLNFSKR